MLIIWLGLLFMAALSAQAPPAICKMKTSQSLMSTEQQSFTNFQQATEETSQLGAMSMPALGRSFTLGMLYDLRTNQMIPSVTLWNHTVLTTKVACQPQPHTSYSLIGDDTFSSKAKAFSIGASLGASFFGGMLSVSGSAGYLHDQKQSDNAQRMGITYSMSARYEQMTMDLLSGSGIQYNRDVLQQNVGTHVVVGIEYGANAALILESIDVLRQCHFTPLQFFALTSFGVSADHPLETKMATETKLSNSRLNLSLGSKGKTIFFVFSIAHNESEKNEISAGLKVTASIFIASASGEATVNVSKNYSDFIRSMNVKFYGDFDIKHPPLTFNKSLTLFRKLPTLLGENYENAVPITVWLYPLSKLDTGMTRELRQISTTLLNEVTDVNQYLLDVQARKNDLSNKSIVSLFPHLSTVISRFDKELQRFKAKVTEHLKVLLPKIHGRGAEESELADLLADWSGSPFAKETLKIWLDSRSTEIDFLTTFLLKSMLGANGMGLEFANETQFANYLGHIESGILVGKYGLPSRDCQVDTMKQYNDMDGQWDEWTPPHPDHSCTAWMQNATFLAEFIQKSIDLHGFAVANAEDTKNKFLLMAMSSSTYPYLTIRSYKMHQMHEFSPPTQPGKPSTSYRNGVLKLQWTAPVRGLQSVTGYEIEFSILFENGSRSEPGTFAAVSGKDALTFSTSNIKDDQTYIFTVRAETEIGHGPHSDPSDVFRTGNFRSMKEVLVVTGGYSSDRAVTQYSLDTTQWTTLPIMNVQRINSGIVCVGNTLFVIGGNSNTVEAYRLDIGPIDSSKWRFVASLPLSTVRDTSAAFANGTIYAVAHQENSDSSWSWKGSTYNLASHSWNFWALPTDVTTWAWLSLTSANNKIYLSATRNDVTPWRNSFYEHVIETGEWRKRNSMVTSRTNYQLVSLPGLIYAIGGTVDSGSDTVTGEVYNCTANKWSYMVSMPSSISQHGTAAAGGKIYLTGGYQRGTGLETAQAISYDTVSKVWETALSLPSARYGLAAATCFVES